MKIKAKAPRVSFDAGVHAAYISEILPVLDSNKQLLKNKNGDVGVDIVFRNTEGKKISFRYWKSESSKWIISELCAALGFQYTGSVEKKHLIGKRLFILVAREYIRENGTRRKDIDNNDVWTPVVLPAFRPLVTEEIVPDIVGAPKSKDEEPSGIFVREKEIITEYQDLNWINFPKQHDLTKGF